MSLPQLFSDIIKWRSLGENLLEEVDESALKKEALDSFERDQMKKAYQVLERFKGVQEDQEALKKDAEDIEHELRSLILEEKKELPLLGGESVILNLHESKGWQCFCQEVRAILKVPEMPSNRLYDRQFLSQESDDLLHFFDIAL